LAADPPDAKRKIGLPSGTHFQDPDMSVTDSETFRSANGAVMEVHRLEREFLYSGVKLPDTAPTITPEQVRETYTHLYPEIATAAIEGLKRSLANWFTSLFAPSERRSETQQRLLAQETTAFERKSATYGAGPADRNP
jgi:PRTRC genetic system protein C